METESMAVTSGAIRADGTMRWLAPDFMKGNDDACNCVASDVYAYACTCYEVRFNYARYQNGFLPYASCSLASILSTTLSTIGKLWLP
jgi:serine/threonine protein kinase